MAIVVKGDAGYAATSGDDIQNKYLGTSYILTNKADFEPGRSSDFILKIKFLRVFWL